MEHFSILRKEEPTDDKKYTKEIQTSSARTKLPFSGYTQLRGHGQLIFNSI